MVKVFLVEDEVIVRNGIRDTIRWENEGMVFVGEAGDGELAYPLIMKTKPDILITDIRMPFMDGLELSRIIKKELPQTKIIILSGYGEFEYAKQAIDIGVTNYLLKPISSVKLLEALNEVKQTIIKKREQDEVLARYESDEQERKQLAVETFYGQLVTGSLSAANILQRSIELEITFCSRYYQVVIVKFLTRSNDGECWAMKWQAEADLKAMIEQQAGIRGFSHGIEGMVLIIEAEEERRLNELVRLSETELNRIADCYPNVYYFGGIGRIIERLGDMPKSYYEAARAFANRFFMDWNQLIGSDRIINVQQEEAGQIDFEEIQNSKTGRSLVADFLKSGTKEETTAFIEEYFKTIGEKNYKSLLFRKYIVMDIFTETVSFLDRMGKSSDDLTPESQDINGVMMQAGSLQAVKDYLAVLFADSISLRDQISNKKYGVMIAEAKEYIRGQYSNNELSLNQVAAFVGMSPSYFSSLFSQETGQTFIENVTAIRMEKAKELLMCTSLRTSEIGYQVGYKDAHYFSYLFKKMVSCSPKEYRSRGKAD